MSGSARPIDVVRVGPGTHDRGRDLAAAEEPLEIRIGGAPFVVTMRTPGHDRDLAAGFLLSEGIVRAAGDIGAIRHCANARAHARENIIDVTLTDRAAARAEALIGARRFVTVTSACGVCGRRSIDDLTRRMPRVEGRWSVTRTTVLALPSRLRTAQNVFDETGGLHAAALFDREARLVAAAEDVGRHNAVDKVVGAELLMDRLPLGERILLVSGRTSFEIIQKAVAAGIAFVAAVSAPSSLAVDLAREAGVTLLGFVRGDTFNIYTGEERVDGVS